MPELPEVETVKATLEKQIVGKKIKEVEVYYSKMLEDITEEEFKEVLKNEKICSFFRYGKYLVFILENISLISHLRMEGKYFIKDQEEPIQKHEHIVFKFTDNTTLRYHDTRKFGIMAIVKSTDISEIMKYKGIAKLGEEANVSTNYQGLYEKIKNKNLPIKTLLLDQENLAGLGNIYVDEVCFKSGIHPLTLGSDLTIEQSKSLLDNARSVLNKAIECGGTTIRSYTSSLGVTGRFQINLMVHTKAGDACSKCGTTIEKIVVGGRGTYLCPHCQKIYQKIKIKVIGITGVISSGKTMVTNYLVEQGYPIIDADVISRMLLEKDSKELPSIMQGLKDKWGKEEVDTFYQEGIVNRTLLGKIVFEDANKRQDLNNLIHPIVKKIIISTLKRQKNAIIKKMDQKPLIFVSVPLLLEAGYEDLCDSVMLISCPVEVITERLMKRDKITKEYALQKIASQMSLEDKIDRCIKVKIPYTIIDNNQDITKTYQEIDEMIKNI